MFFRGLRLQFVIELNIFVQVLFLCQQTKLVDSWSSMFDKILDIQIRLCIWKLFFLFLNFDTQKNHLNDMVLLNSQNTRLN